MHTLLQAYPLTHVRSAHVYKPLRKPYRVGSPGFERAGNFPYKRALIWDKQRHDRRLNLLGTPLQAYPLTHIHSQGINQSSCNLSVVNPRVLTGSHHSLRKRALKQDKSGIAHELYLRSEVVRKMHNYSFERCTDSECELAQTPRAHSLSRHFHTGCANKQARWVH